MHLVKLDKHKNEDEKIVLSKTSDVFKEFYDESYMKLENELHSHTHFDSSLGKI